MTIINPPVINFFVVRSVGSTLSTQLLVNKVSVLVEPLYLKLGKVEEQEDEEGVGRVDIEVPLVDYKTY